MFLGHFLECAHLADCVADKVALKLVFADASLQCLFAELPSAGQSRNDLVFGLGVLQADSHVGAYLSIKDVFPDDASVVRLLERVDQLDCVRVGTEELVKLQGVVGCAREVHPKARLAQILLLGRSKCFAQACGICFAEERDDSLESSRRLASLHQRFDCLAGLHCYGCVFGSTYSFGYPLGWVRQHDVKDGVDDSRAVAVCHVVLAEDSASGHDSATQRECRAVYGSAYRACARSLLFYDSCIRQPASALFFWVV